MQPILISAALFVLPLVVVLMAYRMMFRETVSDPTISQDRYKLAIQSLVTVSLLSGFLLLTWVGKIEPTIFGNTFSMILAFWFARHMENGNGNGPPKR